MDAVSVTLFLLLAVVLSDLIARALASVLPFTIPKPLIQVAFGAAMGLIPSMVVSLDPEVFFLLLLAPLPVAFALAAVLSPTDPIAVSAIARRVPMPPRMMQVLQGESLLNDASGLVCFKLAVAAVAAVLTGGFRYRPRSSTSPGWLWPAWQVVWA